MYIILGVFQAP